MRRLSGTFRDIFLRLLKTLEHLMKFCGRLQRRFLSSGEALATEHSIRFAVHLFYCAVCRSDLRWSRNEARTQKDRSLSKSANGYRISLTALKGKIGWHLRDMLLHIGSPVGAPRRLRHEQEDIHRDHISDGHD
jgi:hypothetical protein